MLRQQLEPQERSFSAAFLYGHLRRGKNCSYGAKLLTGIDTAIVVGSVPISKYGEYDPSQCALPDDAVSMMAASFLLDELRERIEPERRAPDDLDRALVDFRDALQQNLPIVFTLPVSNEFMTAYGVSSQWSKELPLQGELHAMVITAHRGGASCAARAEDPGLGAGGFLVRSSWGTDWGIDGSLWVDDCQMLRRMDEAFVLHGRPDDAPAVPLSASIEGLVVEPVRDGLFIDFRIDAEIGSNVNGRFQLHLVISGANQRSIELTQVNDPRRRPFDQRAYFVGVDTSLRPIIIPSGPLRRHRITVRRSDLADLLDPGEHALTGTLQLLRYQRSFHVGSVLAESTPFTIPREVIQ